MGKPSRYYLLRDDEFFAPGVTTNFVEFWDYTYSADANLHIPRSIVTVGNPPNLDVTWDPQVWAASGRITTEAYDQIIHAHRTSSPGGWFGLFFVDRNTQAPVLSYYLSGLADRVSAAIVWDTAGFGPSTAGGSRQYRIYVVLDLENTIDEIYDTEDPNQTYRWVDINGQPRNLQVGIDPGQNNEGFGLATIVAANPSPSPADLSPSLADSGCGPGTAADVSSPKGSVAAFATDPCFVEATAVTQTRSATTPSSAG
jgi:hypothetical protein